MEYEKLCRAVEEQLHREMHTPADFEYLSEQLLKKTGSSVSSTTLMRLWGYRPSVTVRMSTLDILARFIGYEDYTHFHRAKMEREAEEETTADVVETAEEERVEQAEKALKEKEAAKDEHHHFRYRWMTTVVAMLLAVAAGTLLYLYYSTRTHEDVQTGMSSTNVEGNFISKLSEVRNDRKYLIHTRKDRRGVLGICGRHLASTYGIARFYRSEEPSPFALIQYEGNYYLYSVLADRFINVLLYLTNEPLRQDFGEKNWCAFDIRPERGGFVFDFRSNTRIYTLNVNAGDGMIIDDWGASINAYDDGNLFTLEDVGPFDPSEAMSLLQHSEEQQ